jgi:glutathione synthase/RimK-type ligase-like ATP-grasp enzyme
MPPLRDALASRGLDWEEHFVDGGTLNLTELPAEGVYINRMSPSAHTRNHQGGVAYLKEFLCFLEMSGRRIINGSNAFALEVSKVRQDSALRAAGIRTPKTIAVVGNDNLKDAARQMALPFITKHNQGGKGLGVQLFRDYDAFDRYVDGDDFIPSPDGITLLQQYIEPAGGYITRVEIVDGTFMYAINSSTEGGFQLCPADACAIDDADFCPVGDTGKFSLSEDISATDPLVRKYIRLMLEQGLDVAGIEFVTDKDGVRYTYDINGTSNYNGGVEDQSGFHGMGAIADLVKRELGTRLVRAPAAK